MSKTEELMRIYNSRTNILEIMEHCGYNIDRYKGFSINEISAMINQLDMILEGTNNRKVYIKYFLETLNAATIDNIAEELFEVTDVLNKDTDTLFIITRTNITDSLMDKMRTLWNNRGLLVVVEHISRLQFNILKHKLVPSATLLSSTEIEAIAKKYAGIDKLSQLSRFDPVAKAMCVRPGEVVKFMRPSETAILTPYYRRCVEY